MQCHVSQRQGIEANRQHSGLGLALGVELKPREEFRRALDHRSAPCYLPLGPSLGLDKLTRGPISQLELGWLS